MPTGLPPLSPLFPQVTPKSCLKGFPACHRNHSGTHSIDVVSNCSCGQCIIWSCFPQGLAVTWPLELCLPLSFCLPPGRPSQVKPGPASDRGLSKSDVSNHQIIKSSNPLVIIKYPPIYPHEIPNNWGNAHHAGPPWPNAGRTPWRDQLIRLMYWDLCGWNWYGKGSGINKCAPHVKNHWMKISCCSNLLNIHDVHDLLCPSGFQVDQVKKKKNVASATSISSGSGVARWAKRRHRGLSGTRPIPIHLASRSRCGRYRETVKLIFGTEKKK